MTAPFPTIKITNAGRYRKAIAAGVAGAAVIADAVIEVITDGEVSLEDVIQVGLAVAGVFGVYRLPNDPA